MQKTMFLPNTLIPSEYPDVFYTEEFYHNFYMHYALLPANHRKRGWLPVHSATMFRNPQGALLVHGEEASMLVTAPLAGGEIYGNKMEFVGEATARVLSEIIGVDFWTEQLDNKVVFLKDDGVHIVRMCFLSWLQTHRVYKVLPNAEFYGLPVIQGMKLEKKSRLLIDSLLRSL